MKNEGKTLDELLFVENDKQEEVANPVSVEKEFAGKVSKSEPLKALNVDIPASMMRDLRVISAHNDVTIKEMVTSELAKLVKREKKKIIEGMNIGN